MSEMSYLEKLLDGVEVEWKAVGDIAGYSTTKVDADKLDATSFVGVDNLLADKGGRIDATYQPNTARLTAYEPGDILLGNIRPYLKKVWMAENNGGCSGDVLAIRILADCKKIISPEYLYYALSSDSFFSYSMQHAKGAKMPRGSKDAILNYQIPIPCPSAPGKSLAIQSEIVRILDKFTELTAELTAELTMRKKQYNYYRDQLLSFEEGEVEWKTLGDVTKKWYSGGTPTAGKAEYYENGDIPWLRTQEVKFSDIDSTEIKITQVALKKSAAKWIPENCVIIAISGATAGRSAINKIPLTTNQHCGCLEIDDSKALYRYVFHWISFNYENIKLLGQGARGDLNSTIIKNFKLPIPYATDPDKSLEEQARIVEILDKFDTLTCSINEGLPREIELRQKQYEYYRDLLFSFPKPETSSN
ncbi:restriction endonuclease subunit S [Enterobacter hormaechei]|uniref:restriction endonuclease subunit S n=1 Tax=Enterobacter hormaechei TaxID=158836 RepID=UPI000F84C468|nr:restriction endonuclease subunit S [Enterobacter hormaechei]RTO80718.1 restriction endonuclease subunit S [Enterobacter hormaechei]